MTPFTDDQQEILREVRKILRQFETLVERVAGMDIDDATRKRMETALAPDIARIEQKMERLLQEDG